MNLSLTEVFPCPTGPVERGLDFHPRALQKTSPGAMLLFLRSQEILHNISSGKLGKIRVPLISIPLSVSNELVSAPDYLSKPGDLSKPQMGFPTEV